MPGWFRFRKTGLLAAGGPCFLQSTCNDCDKGIQANDNGCKYASLYHVFHNIRFNTLKKAKHQAKGNSIIHQLKNMGDKMMQRRVEFRPWVICVSLWNFVTKANGYKGIRGTTFPGSLYLSAMKILMQKLKNIFLPQIYLQEDNVMPLGQRLSIWGIHL